jgi:hypothetical protein
MSEFDMSQLRKSAFNYLSPQDAAEYCDLLRVVLRRELRAHYELPQGLPHQILTLMMALNDQCERLERNREARDALALSAAGVMVVTVVWNLMLLFY